MKSCICCGQEKPLDAYYAHPQMADGHLGKCKVCVREVTKTRRSEHPEKVLVSRLATCKKDPSKYNAHQVVSAALACGVLVKPRVCDRCGGVNEEHGRWRIHSHHEDYSKPLEVDWLCPKCHADAHPEKFAKIECGLCGKSITRIRMVTHMKFKHPEEA
jgi:hypothetical protein